MGPDDQGQQSFPERQFQIADCEQPAGEPNESKTAMLFNSYSLFVHCVTLTAPRQLLTQSGRSKEF
jgi:hypothetical protein